jgi:hypothetical protein
VLWLAACGPAVGMGEEDGDAGDGDSGSDDADDLPEPAGCGTAAGPIEVASVTVTTESFEPRLVLTAEHLVVFASSELLTMPRCGETLSRVGELTVSAPKVATDGVAAFWIEDGRLLALDPSDGTIEPLAEISDTVDEIAAGSGRVYLGLHFAGERSGLHVVDAADRSFEQLMATPAGERISEIVPAGDDVYVRFSPDDGTDRPESIVRVHGDGELESVLAEVDRINAMAVVDGVVVLRRSSGAPDYIASMEGRSQATGELLWSIEGDDVPEDIAVAGGSLHGASKDGATIRLFDIPGDGPPMEWARITGASDRLGFDLVVDRGSAFQVEAELVCNEPCDDVMFCSPPYCEHTPLFPMRVTRTDF